MKNIKKSCFVIVAGLICIHFLGAEALATEPAGNWRSIYDLTLRWINFLILAFIIVKFGKKPLVNFLQIRREETERNIKRAEEKKKKAQAEIEDIRKRNNENRLRYATLKERIMGEGDKRKKEIIEGAQQQSRLMIKTAKQKAENQILEARAIMKLELMDAAIALAEKKLPGLFTAEDDSNWISQIETRMHKPY